MSAEIIDGKSIAKEIRAELKIKITELKEAGTIPSLAIVQIGGDEGSITYSKSIIKSAEKLGLKCDYFQLEKTEPPEECQALMKRLAEDNAVHGIILQRPVPPPHSELSLSLLVPPEKDVDCANPLSMGYLAVGEPKLLPCTPDAIIEIIQRSGIETSGKRVVIVGRSNVVGKPLALLLAQKSSRGNATVTICHTRTKDLKSELKRAEIVIAACGSPGLITGEMLSSGSIVIDAGINWSGGKMTGDVEFDSAAEIVAKITPVPGGVGPVTGVMLFKNLLNAVALTQS